MQQSKNKFLIFFAFGFLSFIIGISLSYYYFWVFADKKTPVAVKTDMQCKDTTDKSIIYSEKYKQSGRRIFSVDDKIGNARIVMFYPDRLNNAEIYVEELDWKKNEVFPRYDIPDGSHDHVINIESIGSPRYTQFRNGIIFI